MGGERGGGGGAQHCVVRGKLRQELGRPLLVLLFPALEGRKKRKKAVKQIEREKKNPESPLEHWTSASHLCSTALLPFTTLRKRFCF